MPQQQAEYMTCTPLRDKRQIPLAPRAPSIHEPVEGRPRARRSSVYHLVGVNVEARERGRAEAGRERYIGGVAAVRHQDAADARGVVAGIERVPASAEVDLE